MMSNNDVTYKLYDSSNYSLLVTERGEIPPAHFSLATIYHYFLCCFEHSLVKKKFFFEEKLKPVSEILSSGS